MEVFEVVDVTTPPPLATVSLFSHDRITSGVLKSEDPIGYTCITITIASRLLCLKIKGIPSEGVLAQVEWLCD